MNIIFYIFFFLNMFSLSSSIEIEASLLEVGGIVPPVLELGAKLTCWR